MASGDNPTQVNENNPIQQMNRNVTRRIGQEKHVTMKREFNRDNKES
jgi:hypothetical protein